MLEHLMFMLEHVVNVHANVVTFIILNVKKIFFRIYKML